MAPTEIDLVLRSIELLRDEFRLALKEMREDVADRLSDHEQRLRDLEEDTARANAVDGYKDKQRRWMADERRWRMGLVITAAGTLITSLLTLGKLAGLI